MAGFYGQDYGDDGNPALDRLEVLEDALLDSGGLDLIPEPVPLIGGLLYTDSLAWLTGKRGHGKSFVALDIAGHVSGGLDWHGRPVKPGPVLYVAAEGRAGLRQRVRAWEDHHGPMAVTFLPVPVRLPADASTLGRVAAVRGAVLVIIDTQARVTVGLDENSSRDMGLLVDALEVIREASGACVLAVHHEPRNGEHPRGHSTIDGAGTTLLRVTKDGPLVTLTNPKQKDAPEAAPIDLALESHLGSAVIWGHSQVALEGLRSDSEGQLRAVIHEFGGSKGWACFTDLVNDSGMPKTTVRRALKSLLTKGEVANVGTGTRPRYVLADPAELLPAERPIGP